MKKHTYKCGNLKCSNRGKESTSVFSPSEIRQATGQPWLCPFCGTVGLWVMTPMPVECDCGEPAAYRISIATLNGTLLDSEPRCRACAELAAKQAGLEIGPAAMGGVA